MASRLLGNDGLCWTKSFAKWRSTTLLSRRTKTASITRLTRALLAAVVLEGFIAVSRSYLGWPDEDGSSSRSSQRGTHIFGSNYTIKIDFEKPVWGWPMVLPSRWCQRCSETNAGARARE